MGDRASHSIGTVLRLASGIARSVLSRAARLSGAIARSWRELALTQQFMIAASVVICAGMLIIGTWVAERIRKGIGQNTAAAAALYCDNFVAPLAQEIARTGSLGTGARERLDELMQGMVGTKIASINIWRPDGTIVYSTRPEILGRQFPITGDIASALKGSVAVEFNPTGHQGDDWPALNLASVIEVYAPIRDAESGRVIASVEFYWIEAGMADELQQAIRSSWVVVGSVALLMALALIVIVRSGDATIIQQRRRLENQIGQLHELLGQNKDLGLTLERARRRSADLHERLLRRIGADLHDGPAQLLSLALLLLHVPERPPTGTSADGDKAAAAGNGERIRAVLSEALRDIRDMSGGLAFPELKSADLAQTIQLAISAHARRTGTAVASALEDLPSEVPMALKVCVYRSVQEALVNAYKHAGGIGQRVSAWTKGGQLTIEVSDQGPGFRATPERSTTQGLGLAGMRDRVETLGGRLEIESSPAGTCLRAVFDLDRAGRGEASDVG